MFRESDMVAIIKERGTLMKFRRKFELYKQVSFQPVADAVNNPAATRTFDHILQSNTTQNILPIEPVAGTSKEPAQNNLPNELVKDHEFSITFNVKKILEKTYEGLLVLSQADSGVLSFQSQHILCRIVVDDINNGGLYGGL
jgi:hypothetical protein